MAICESYMFGFSVSKDMKKNKKTIKIITIIKEFTEKKVIIGKVVIHLCLTLIIKE